MSETMSNSEKKTEKKSKYKISEEAAIKQIEAFEDFYEIELREDNPEMVKTLLRMIKFGRVSISEDGDSLNVIQHLKKKYDGMNSTLVWAEISARHKVKAGRVGDKKEREKNSMYDSLLNLGASLTTTDRKVLQRLAGVDMSCFETVATVFSLI